MARRYTRPFIGTFFLESRMVVKRARIWVMIVANTKCHVVRKMGNSAVAVSGGQGITSGAHTELGGVENVLVEDNCAGAETNPGTVSLSAAMACV